MKSKILFLSLFFFFVSPAKAETQANPKDGFLFQQLTDVKSKKSFNAYSLKDKKSVWIVFQLDCETCHRVMKESSCYGKKKEIDVLAVGLYAKPKELLKDAKKSGFKGRVLTSALAVDKELDLDVTPTTFIFDKNKLVKRIDAYASCDQILESLNL